MPLQISSPGAFPRDSRSTPWRVMKLGGTTVADVDALHSACGRVVRLAEQKRVAVVVSALAGVTDGLERCLRGNVGWETNLAELRERHWRHFEALGVGADVRLRERLERFRPRLDAELLGLTALLAVGLRRGRGNSAELALSMGERLSARLVQVLLADAGATVVDPSSLVVTRGAAIDARPDLEATRRRTAGHLAGCHARIWVVPGFFGCDAERRLRLLGRGGSDTSATLLGAALDADLVEIWTDVDGVYDADPRRDPSARRFPSLDYDHAERLARAGARVLHGRSLDPARRAGVPIVVRDAFHPHRPGTWIGPTADRRGTEVAA